MSSNPFLFSTHYPISVAQRNKRNGHASHVFWLTGLSGSGKSTLAGKLEERLFKENLQVYILDGDKLRQGLNQGLGFTEEDRYENIRRMAETAKLLMDAGMIVCCAVISPLEKDRALARKIIGTEFFSEIFIDTPLEECEKRDVKGLYLKARSGEITNFTGVSAPYEPPRKPEVHLITKNQSIQTCTDQLYAYIKNKIKLDS